MSILEDFQEGLRGYVDFSKRLTTIRAYFLTAEIEERELTKKELKAIYDLSKIHGMKELKSETS